MAKKKTRIVLGYIEQKLLPNNRVVNVLHVVGTKLKNNAELGDFASVQDIRRIHKVVDNTE